MRVVFTDSKNESERENETESEPYSASMGILIPFVSFFNLNQFWFHSLLLELISFSDRDYLLQ